LVTGLTYGVMNNSTIGPVSGSLTAPFSGSLGPVPDAAIYGWILAALVWFIYRYRPIGRKLLFIGGNRQAAQLIGLRVKGIRFSAFVLCALFAGLAGLMFLGQIGQADPADGAQLLLPAYSAAFLGATAVQVGRFNVIGTVIALYVLIVGVTGLELAGAPTWIGQVFNGAALALAVGLSRLARARAKRRDLRATS
jgi:ribose transport system permease protein